MRIIKAQDFDFPTAINGIKTFATKADAESAAKSIGWLRCHVLKFEKRFETVWIVGQWFMSGEEICGITFDAFIYPLFEWEKDSFGIQKMKTAKAVAKTSRPF